MAKKRVHELAKERDMSPRDMLAKLQAAGLPVKAVASAVDEQDAKDALAGKPISSKQNGSGNGATRAPVQRPGVARPLGSGSDVPAQRPSRERQIPGQRGPAPGERPP